MWRLRHNGAIFCPVIDGCGVTGATAALSRFPPPLMFPSVSSEAVCGCQVHPFTSLSFLFFFSFFTSPNIGVPGDGRGRATLAVLAARRGGDRRHRRWKPVDGHVTSRAA